jgi:SNF2 family DNA or RNA helicase
MNPVLFHGRLTLTQRLANLHRFREDSKCQLILMTYGSGGVGLNLQCANYVFLFDQWWNPAIEEQAINRAHRIGQTQPVTVTRYMMIGTIESRIQEILERKRALFQQVITEESDTAKLGLTLEELCQLFEFVPGASH